jgi:multiple sugar transport system substrate-binding protein
MIVHAGHTGEMVRPTPYRLARSTIDRRAFLRLLGLGGGTIIVGACGTSVAPETGRQVSLTFWTPGGGGDWCAQLDSIAKDFQEHHPSIHIGPTQCGGGGGEQGFTEVLLAQIAAGNPPDAAILWTSPAALAARGSLEALDELMQTALYAHAANWPPAILASCRFEGKTYGLPVTAGSCGLWYNREMFERKGIPAGRDDFPKTWAELRRLSKEFTSWRRDRLETAGFIPWHVAEELPIWSALNGAQLYDAASRRYTIDAEPNVAMMAYAVEWLDQEYKGDFAQVMRSGNWEGYEIEGRQPAFMDQRQAMFVAYSWNIGSPAHTHSAFRWDMARFPVGPNGRQTVAGYWPNWLVILKGARHLTQAFNWLDYLSGVGVQAWFRHFPDLPSNRLVPRDLLPTALVAGKGEAFAQDIMHFFRDQLDIATPMWDSPIQDFATDQIRRALEQIMYKVARPRDALVEVQGVCQRALEKVFKTAA